MEDEIHFTGGDDDIRVKRGRRPGVCCVIATVLGVVVLLSLVVIAGLSIGVNRLEATSSKTCLDPECVELGAQVLASLDETFDPCVDFYKFACNKALEQTIIPFGSQTAGTFNTLAELQEERFRVQLSKPVDDSADLNATSKAATYYQSCVATPDDMDSQALNSLYELLSDLGGWPLVGIGEDTSFDINDEDGFLTEILYGSKAFLSFFVYPRPDDSSQNILVVGQGGLTFPKVVYQNDSYMDVIRSEVLKVLNSINPNISDSVYIQAIEDVMALERTIYSFTDFDPPSPDNFSTFGSLAELMPEFHWVENLKFYGRLGNFPIKVDSSTKVVNLAPVQFLTGMDTLISDTNSATLQNYAKWHAIFNLLPLLGDDFSPAYHSLTNLLTGKKYEGQPRYIMCVGDIENQMPFAMARVLAEAYSPDGLADSISTIVTGIRAALKERISEKDWLDSTTKQRALNKVDNIIDFLVYPDIIYDNDKLNEIYSSLEVSASDSYFDNSIRLTKFTTLNMIGRLSQENNRNDWELDIPPTVVNAFYNPQGNQIYILEGILGIPFFKTYWPDYFKFGTIGLVIGHELVHGFDNNGRLYDENGNFADWWSEQAVEEFNTRAQCFVDQYNQYSLPAGPVNGTQTLGENIADNGGLATAYQAYKDMGEAEKMLPGLKYNPDQLFFIGSAQAWCAVATLEAQKKDLEKNVHTPSTLRPLGFLSNSPEFANAFNCPSGSRMNPTHKCEIW